MADDKLPDTLSTNTADYVATAAKAVLGCVPVVGSLLAELAGTVIPNQRTDRLVRFAAELGKRLEATEQASIRSQLTNENFTDLVEEGLREAARSTSDERRQHIAQVIANSIMSEEITYIESKHLLRILGEINDIEVIWLRFYLHPSRDGDEAFRAKHDNLLRPIAAHMDSPQSELDEAALQESYKHHLCRIGLLRERYKIDNKTKMPEIDNNGHPKILGYGLTQLGQLLLRQMGFAQ